MATTRSSSAARCTSATCTRTRAASWRVTGRRSPSFPSRCSPWARGRSRTRRLPSRATSSITTWRSSPISSRWRSRSSAAWSTLRSSASRSAGCRPRTPATGTRSAPGPRRSRLRSRRVWPRGSFGRNPKVATAETPMCAAGTKGDAETVSTEQKPTRVLIVDDHAVVRAGLRLLLDNEPDLEVVGEAGNGTEAVFAAVALVPDVVLMDLVMAGINGIEATRQLLEKRPATNVLVLSMQDDATYVREVFAAGALGYVLKEAADTELVSAVRHVAAGDQHLDPALGARLAAADAVAERAQPGPSPLSEREHEVL